MKAPGMGRKPGFLPRRRRPLRALQVEVTSRCTRRCRLCPRGQLADRWLDRDLEPASWAAIVPALPLAAHVHLQGWGEPLLHPGLPEMVAAARRAGCSVGFTTNGDLLAAAAGWIVDQRVDVVAVSVAGGSGLNPLLRDGQRVADVLSAAGKLQALAGRRGRPKVELSYLLTRDNASGLEQVVEDAARHGLAELFVVHLTSTPTPELESAAAYTPDGLTPGVAEALRRAGERARRVGLRFRPPATRPADLITCSLDPTRYAFVASDGRVGPCVNALLPIRGDIPRCGEGHVLEVPHVSFGEVATSGLAAVLSGAPCQRFAAPFSARLAAEAEFRWATNGSYGSLALEGLEEADAKRSAALAAHPFPAECAGCPLRLGW